MKILRWLCCVPLAFIAYCICSEIIPYIWNLLLKIISLWSKFETAFVPGADVSDILGFRDWLVGWIILIIGKVVVFGISAFVYGLVGGFVAPKVENIVKPILVLGSYGILTIFSIWLYWNSEALFVSIVIVIIMLISVFFALVGYSITEE